MIHRFSGYEIDTELYELRLDGAVVKVEPQVYSLLELLVSNSDRVVTKDEINKKIWDGRVVSDAALNTRVKAARQAIGDDGKAQKLIKTIHGRGFRFMGRVEPESAVSQIASVNDDLASLSDISKLSGPDEAVSNNTGSRPSIAVLPLQVLTPNEKYTGLGDAVSQEIIVELCHLHWLHVIARASSFRLRNPEIDLSEIGLLLGVRYLLTGTISFYNDTSVVTVELMHIPDNRIVWAERFNRPVEDLLELRLTISSHIVMGVESKIQAVEATHAANVPTENLDAWSAYHRGLWHMYRFNPSDTEIAQNMFQRAVDADKNFCRAYAGLSYTNFQKVFQLYTPDAAHHRELARRHAEKSLELDPMDPFANLVKGRSQWLEGDVESALEWTSRSTEINPNYATALYNKALLNSNLCNGEGGAEDITKAIGLSPIDPLIQSMLAIRALSAFLNKDNESALSWAGKALRAPNLHPYAVAIAAIVYGHNGKDEEARQCVEKIRQQNSSFTCDDFFARFSMKDASILEHSRTLLKSYGL